jgi:hypothetical protein
MTAHFLAKDSAVSKDGFTQDIIQSFEHLQYKWLTLLFCWLPVLMLTQNVGCNRL